MAQLDTSDPHTTPSASWRWPSVHPDGRKFVVIAGAVTLLLFVLGVPVLSWVMVGVSIWVAAFFRDPIRSVPQGPGLVVSPADGLVIMVKEVAPPPELAGEGGLDGTATRVSIFMSVFDVHINRAPVAGTIRRVAYVAGKFVNASLDKASEQNERNHILVEGVNGTMIGFTQIAGLVARRIVPFVKPGDLVAAGQRVGLIRFGSRVDVYLPAGTAAKVTLGQRAIAGETVLARLGDGEPVRGVAQ